jgi:hypothetical protein
MFRKKIMYAQQALANKRLVKFLLTLINTSLYRRFNKTRNKYESIIKNIKNIIEEKNYIIGKIEEDNKELISHYEKFSANTKVVNIENDGLKKRVIILENKIQLDQERFKDLFETNLTDIKRKSNIFI